MRLIDADALNIYDVSPADGFVVMGVTEEDIDLAPTIDAVSVVRCKECRYWEMRNSPRGWCVVHQGYVSPQYFCADGERKESE
jgi:hypothetical protein